MLPLEVDRCGICWDSAITRDTSSFMMLQLQTLRYLHLVPRRFASHLSVNLIKAVAFDLGGVVVPSVTPLFNTFENEHGLQRGAIVSAIQAGGEQGMSRITIGN